MSRFTRLAPAGWFSRPHGTAEKTLTGEPAALEIEVEVAAPAVILGSTPVPALEVRVEVTAPAVVLGGIVVYPTPLEILVSVGQPGITPPTGPAWWHAQHVRARAR